MITASEKKALQLAKKVFEHFTHDALPIAREIIAMELELRESPSHILGLILLFTDIVDSIPLTVKRR